jgi:hypothetical protein
MSRPDLTDDLSEYLAPERWEVVQFHVRDKKNRDFFAADKVFADIFY